ncbi:MAG: fibronectin type III domain-containing protein [Eubacterium sp.]
MQPVLIKVKKVLCILLSVLMLVSALPITAFAYEGVTFTALDGTAGASTAGGTENYDKLLDGSLDTKWCVTNFSGAYIVIEASSAINVSGYQMSTGDDTASEKSRNPKDWTLYGCNDYDTEAKTGSWDVIHKVIGDTVLQFTNKTTYSFACDMTDVEYKYFKLEITKNSGSQKCMQLSEFALTDCAHETTVVSTVEVDCTNYGYVEKSCSVCSLTYKTITEEAKGHTWVEESKTPATCTQYGKINQKCSVCNETQSIDDSDAPALGHTWVEVDRTPATCAVSGKINQKCSVCDVTRIIDNSDVPALGHEFVNGYCTRCLNADTTPVKPKGDGTVESPYEISNAGELYWFAGLVNGTLTDGTAKNSSANAKLTADITVNRNVLKADGSIADDTRDFAVWKPIGYNVSSGRNDSNAYKGTFDGQGHTISGLYFKNSFNSQSYYAGLFGYCLYSSISNVCLSDSYIEGYKSIAGICGFLQAGYITNCKNSATVVGGDWTGGICGAEACNSENYNQGRECVIANCYNDGLVISANLTGGSIIGLLDRAYAYNCYNNSNACSLKAGYVNSSSFADKFLNKTAEEIATGEVAYWLSQGYKVGEKIYDGSIWGQKIGTDSCPVLNGDRVYANGRYSGCINAPGDPVDCVFENTEGESTYADHKQSDDYISNNDATCTEDGTKSIKCIYCGLAFDTVTDEGSALGHDWADATCLAPKTCKRCGETEGGLGEHSYAIVSQRPATCNADGFINYKCTVCSDTKQEVITVRPDHRLNDSYDRYDSETNSVITSCVNKDSCVVEFTEDLPESKHNYDNNISEEYVLDYPGATSIDIYFNSRTYTESGYDYIYIYKDSASGEQVGKYTGTALAGKAITVNSSKAVIKLTSDGSNTDWGFKVDKVVATYPGCGYETSVPHTTHNVTTYTSDNNATCTEDGTKTGTCTVCNNPVTVQDEGSKLGHDLVEVADAVNATCFSVGWTAGYKCSRCDYEVRQEEIKMLPHTTKTTTTRATASKDGKIVKTCTVCKKTVSTTVIPKASSVKLSATSYTYNGKVKTPSVTVKDSKGKTLKKNTDYTVSYAKGRKSVGKYAVKITFKGNYSGTKTLYFYVKPKATSISSVSGGSKKFTVKWKKQATQTTGYQIQYSTNSKFSKAKTVTVGKNSTTSKTVSKLSAKKKYYVRVRTYKTVKINGKATKIYSSWSKAKAVTTKK